MNRRTFFKIIEIPGPRYQSVSVLCSFKEGLTRPTSTLSYGPGLLVPKTRSLRSIIAVTETGFCYTSLRHRRCICYTNEYRILWYYSVFIGYTISSLSYCCAVESRKNNELQYGFSSATYFFLSSKQVC